MQVVEAASLDQVISAEATGGAASSKPVARPEEASHELPASVTKKQAVQRSSTIEIPSQTVVESIQPQQATAGYAPSSAKTESVGAGKTAASENVQHAVKAETPDQTVASKTETTAVANAAGADNAVTVASAGGLRQVTETSTIRSGPGELNDVLGWIGKGALVRPLGQQGDWVKVQIPDGKRSGWMKASALQGAQAREPGHAAITTASSSSGPGAKAAPVQRAEQPAVAPLATANSAKPAQMAGRKQGVLSFSHTANLRAGPGMRFDVVAWAGQGSYARELERKGDWVRVQLQQSGRIGWVVKSLIRQTQMTGGFAVAKPLSGQVTEAPVMPTAATVTSGSRIAKSDKVPPQVKAAAAHRKSQPVQRVVGKKPVNKEQQPQVLPVHGVAVAPVAAVSANGANGRSLFSFNRKANLRAGPDVKFDVVSWAGVGAYAYELGRKGDWVRVQMEVSKRIGWVYNRSLKLVRSGVVRHVAAVKSGQVSEQIAKQSPHLLAKRVPNGLFRFKQTTNLRAGPGKQYDVVTWGGKNETAAVLKRRGDWRKVRMSMSGKQGWVFRTTLASAGSGHAVAAAVAKVKQPNVKMYQVLRTEPLRADAMKFAELSGWVGKGESVALLEQRQGWLRVQPQDASKKPGWIQSDYLKATGEVQANTRPKKELRTVAYQDRISRGEDFNFSYAALEAALYRVPVEDISVLIHRDDLKALFRKDTYDKSYFDIRVKSGRHRLNGRIKVLGSSTRIFRKKSLLIKLDKESARWYGRRRIALRSMASDKALMREWMAWKLLAALGMKVPEVHFTRVSFNHGEKTGLYLNIQWMGRRFLKENHLEVDGGFYQPNDASHCGDLNSSDNMDLCFDKISPQDGDYSVLSAMAKAVSTASPANMDRVLAKYFNEESVINWVAVNALVTNGDTYNKNYWLHYSPNHHKWTMVPWDYNLTFGRVYDPFGVKPYKIFNDNFQYYFPIDVGASNPLKDKLIRNPKLRARLETRLKHLIGLQPNGPEETFGWFSPTVMQARIGNLAAVVGKEVYKDTFLRYGEGDFTKTYESLMHFVTEHDYFLKSKLQGPYRWQPSPSFDPNAPPVLVDLPKALYGEGTINVGGQSLHMTDQGWGYFVARLNLDEPLKKKTQFKVRIEGDAMPKYLPVGQAPGRCIRRSWRLSTPTPGVSANGELMVEYLQENSKRTEVPETLHEEMLELWVRDAGHWRPLKTEVNEYSNTLIAKGVHVESGHVQRFVACSPF